MVYEWKRNMPVKAQVAGDYLEVLEKKHGHLTQGIIVKESEPADATLHSLFEWDNDIAADKYRETQAGFILRNLVVVSVSQQQSNEKPEVRAFVNITNKNDCGYISINTAMRDEETRSHILKTALSELQAFKSKYQQLSELAHVFEAIGKIAI